MPLITHAGVDNFDRISPRHGQRLKDKITGEQDSFLFQQNFNDANDESFAQI